mmetsp:Transcript_59386/g.112083  ORF Transcript_59386/g.112083 Transcript_59386/m.112083 type:complete len:83 (+) Transcript_59386:320-568(+)
MNIQLIKCIGGHTIKDVFRVATQFFHHESMPATTASRASEPPPKDLFTPLKKMATEMFIGSMTKLLAAIRAGSDQLRATAKL